MITNVHTEGFQSLDDVDLELGKLTVVVGASSSGKSALVRAIRGVTSNVRGPAAIQRGKKALDVSVQTDDGPPVRFTKTKTASSYTVGSTTFTKLGVNVPEAVTQALGMPPGPDLHLAGQFDRPYLLDDSGAAVARVLGELTNVSVIYGAAREANRIKLSKSGVLATRTADLAKAEAALEAFATLDDEVARQESIEANVLTASGVQSRLGVLTGLLLGVKNASEAVAALVPPTRLDPARQDRATALYASLTDLQTRLDVLAVLDTDIVVVARNLEADRGLLTRVDALLVTATADYHAIQGICPTCGADPQHQHPERVA